MNAKKKSNWKKIFGFGTAILLVGGSATGIGFSAYNIATKTNISSDFKEGRTFEIKLRLFKETEDGKILLNDKNKPVAIYNDEKTTKDHVEGSAKYLTSLLEQKGLTNINVSYGYGFVNNEQTVGSEKIFKDGQEPVAVLYAKFENSQAAFGLHDIEQIENEYVNNQMVNKVLTDSPLYEIESVKSTYNNGPNYNLVAEREYAVNPNETKRTGTLYLDEKENPILNDVVNSLNILDNDVLDGGKVGEFKLKDGSISTADIGLNIDEKNSYGAKYFNSKQFGEDFKEHKLAEREDNKNEGDNDQTTPEAQPTDAADGKPNITLAQKFQTTQTWIIWKNKNGLLDYLNSLITLWYYNVYANEVPEQLDISSTTDKTSIISQLFDTGDHKYKNGVDIETRKKINTVINSLTETEKSFIAWAALNNKLNTGAFNAREARPPLMVEADIIPVLYSFYNSPKFSPKQLTKVDELSADNPVGLSESVKNGWWFLESNSTDLNEFIGAYYGGTLDYRNYNTHFEDPNDLPEPTEEEKDPIREPFVVSSYKIDANDYGSTPKLLIEKWNNAIYRFPVLETSNRELLDNSQKVFADLTTIGNYFKIMDKDAECDDKEEKTPDQVPQWIASGKLTKCQYDYIKKIFANKWFNSSALFNPQFQSPASLNESFMGINPLYVLLIAMSIILFVVGIFVAWRFRIPGLLAFIISGVVFVCSTAIYNAFGFVFSFYSMLALAISTFISFITPSFLFRNVKKEIADGSTLSAAIIKSTKKYWKLSLDIHIMGILSALSFLFFGKTGNINFGSMLVVSIFLSFILSGMIFYILLLFYVYVIRFEFVGWFLSNKLYAQLRKTDLGAVKKIKFLNTVSFFKKWDYYVVGALALVGITGVIVLAVNGPFFSIDFSSSNILVINNFSQYQLSVDEVMKSLKISSINHYISDNQLVIFTINSFSAQSAIDILTTKVDSDLAKSLVNDLIVTTLTSESMLKIVNNAIMCAGIAIGFCAIWSLFSLNIISIIPLALNQVLTMVLLTGVITLVGIPMDINIVPVLVFVFIINTTFSTAMLSSIKSSWDRKRMLAKQDLQLLFNNIISKTNLNYVYVLASILAFAILGLFSSVSLLFCFLVLIFSVVYLFFFNGKILITSLYGCILLRNIFNKELKMSKIHERKVHEYDEVNEQKIIGINN